MSVLKIRKIEIHDFRCFKNISFNLGKVITVIAGHNATGKSTILGLLGHCAELKPKDGRPILQKLFRTEFSEIITASESFDPRNPKVYTIYFSQDNDIPVEPMTFRTTWQKYKDKARFRIIPKPIPTRKEQKLRWPVLYLGLSRLYPIGESEQVTTSKSGLNPEQKQKYFSTYKKILSLNEDPIDCSAITIQETTKKKTVGVTTDKYDSLCNSAGQDNLSQILLAVMSFEVLKEQCGESWNGGLLLIDELDATLHPAAQNKLVKYLYDSAKSLQIQIVFTTHSLSMLDFICEKCNHNNPEQSNNYEIVYLTTRNEYLQQIPNPSYDIICLDMFNTLSILPIDSRKITVYMEDDEARWFFEKLVKKHLSKLRLPKIELSNTQLLKLLKEDYRFYCRTLFIVDGDVEQFKIDELTRCFGEVPNLIKLPGEGISPEKVFFDYLSNLPGDSEVYSELASTGLSVRALRENGPSSYQHPDERVRYKNWFNQFKEIIEEIYPYWENANQPIVNEFLRKFTIAYNSIASQANVPKIRE